MTTYGLTATGFRAKTTTEVLEELREAVKAQLGAGLNTQSDSALGVLLAVLADRIAEAWALGQADYSALDPEQATDDALDALAALTGTTRLPATKSAGTLSATGTPATVLSSGRIVSVDGAPTSRFVTTANATITAATAWAPSTAYSVGDIRTNDSKIYRCITAGTSAGSGGPTGTETDITDGTVHWRYLGDGTGYATVAAEAEETGPVVGNAYSITVIETPVSGWSNVTNIEDADVGTDIETDAALRARRVAELAAIGAGTLETLRAKVAQVTGIEDAIAFENATDETDGSGRPPHSMHVVVEPGTATDADIAQAIFETKPAGIALHGSQSQAVEDSRGTSHTMKWDEATVVDICVTADIDVIADEFPSDGVDQIKAAIVAYGDALLIGRDVIAQKIKSIIWSISGVHDVTDFDIDTSSPPSGESNITIDETEVADFDTSRITINTTPVTPS